MKISWMLAIFFGVSSCTNSLKGKKWRIFFSEFKPHLILKRNSTGQIVGASGGIIDRLNWLSSNLGFSYTFSQLPKKSADESLKYIPNGEVDWLVGVLLVTESRNRLFDLPHPWFLDSASIVMPYPTQSPNTEAPLKPFNVEVWIFLIAATIMAIIAIHVLNLLFNYLFDVSPDRDFRNFYFSRVANSTDYVVTVLMGQGGVCYSKRLNIRLVAAAWCLAACVLLYSYSSILTSFVSAPNREIVVRSLEDIPTKPQLKPIVVKGTGADLILMNSDSGIFKRLRDMLNRDSHLRCPNREACLDMVRSASRVYIDAHSITMTALNEDLKATGKCRYTAVDGGFSLSLISFAVPKSSDYTEHLDKGVMRMWDTGLINLWDKQTIPKPTACLDIKQRSAENPQLSWKNLSGAFVILLIGYAISALTFVVEVLFKRHGSY